MIIDERLSTYIDSISWQIPPYLQEVERQALADGVPIIRRSMQSLLQFLLLVKKPSAVLEIGTAVGFSGMLISECVADTVTIDTIEKVPVRIQNARINFEKYQKTERIHLIEGDAGAVLQQLVDAGKQYDFIFMDAAKGQYPVFLSPILTLLSENGMLVTDNVLQDGDIIESRFVIARRNRTIHSRMREYLYEINHREDIVTTVLPIADGVTLSVKK